MALDMVPRSGPICERMTPTTDGFFERCCLKEQPPPATANCDTCQPNHDCIGKYLVSNSTYFNEHCCGKCGPSRLGNWCSGLDKTELAKYKKSGMCQNGDVAVTAIIANNEMVRRNISCSSCQPQANCQLPT